MFRKSIITTTLAAAAFVTIGSAAPASAGGWDCFIDPIHCIAEELIGAGGSDRPSSSEADGSGVGGGGGLPVPGVGVPAPVGIPVPGAFTDVSPGTARTPQLPPDVLDAITGPVVELPPIELPPLDGPAPVEPPVPAPEPPSAPEEAPDVPTSPVPAPAPARAPAPEPVAEAPHAPEAGPGVPTPPAATPDVATDDGSGVETVESTLAPTDTTTSGDTTVATQEAGNARFDESTARETESLVDMTPATYSNDSIDPMVAALFGVLGTLGLIVIAAVGFAAGRKRS